MAAVSPLGSTSKFDFSAEVDDPKYYKTLILEMNQIYTSFITHRETLRDLEIATLSWETLTKDPDSKKTASSELINSYRCSLKQYDRFDRTREKVRELFKSFQAKKEMCFPGEKILKDIPQQEYTSLLEKFREVNTAQETMEKQLSHLEGLLEGAAVLYKPDRIFRPTGNFFQTDLAAYRKKHQKPA